MGERLYSGDLLSIGICSTHLQLVVFFNQMCDLCLCILCGYRHRDIHIFADNCACVHTLIKSMCISISNIYIENYTER